jgi:hypothetical protein
MGKQKKTLTKSAQAQLVETLKTRFHNNMIRHKEIDWSIVEPKLLKDEGKLWSLNEMEETGGEPDVIQFNKKTKEVIFVDCSPESPKGRRSVCYDDDALRSRKENKPKDSAIEMATRMGIDILTEEQYRELQALGEFDTKSSSWVQTPSKIRTLGGALYCDRRYDTVFVYHNGAESYYAVRGFRGLVRV